MATYKTFDFDDNTAQDLVPWFGVTSDVPSAASAHDGSYGLLITPSEGYWGLQTNTYPGWAIAESHSGVVNTGVSIWLKASQSGVGDVYGQFEFHDSGGTYTSTVIINFVPLGNQAPTSWTKYTGSLTIPNGTYNVFTILAGDSWTAGTLSADTFVIGDLTSPPPPGIQIWNGSAWVTANEGVVKAVVRGAGVWT
jgi:hypothetical protein